VPAERAANARQVMLHVADPDNSLAGVSLQPELRMPAELLAFHRAGEYWELAFDPPPVTRLEYLLELRYADGGSKVSPDPANPREVATAFGPKSVLEFSGYETPAWISAAADPGITRELDTGTPVSARIWAPSGMNADEPLPLLLVHDGPEYDALASLSRYLGAGVTGGWLPPLRAALLGPGSRNNWYSANARYTRMLAGRALPAIRVGVPTTTVIGMGTSLGALAMVHAYCGYPESLDAMFLQSGSFFVPSLDSQERRFPYFRRITEFTATVQAGALPNDPVPVVMTCGAIEENLANNGSILAAFLSHGYPAALHEVPELHNYTAWRDAFDPYLTGLIRQVTG